MVSVNGKRIAYATVDALIAAIVFIVIPLYLLPMIEKYLGVSLPLTSLPYLGVMMVVASFFSGLSKKTRYEGLAVILWSAVTIAYLAYIFWGGRFEATASTLSGESIYMRVEFPVLFYLILSIPAIGIVRGIAMAVSADSRMKKSQVKFNQTEPQEEVNDVIAPHSD
ncbi:MAG: hypothetical protein QXX17_07040 [Conexivisphaerales archaeon]